MSSRNVIVINDGKNLIYRHHYSHRFLSNEDGHPTGAIYGCLEMMLGIAKALPDAGFVWAWDGQGETWRHRMMEEMPQINADKFPDVDTKEEDEEESDTGMSMSFLNKGIQSSTRFLTNSSWGTSENSVKKSGRKSPKGYKANRKKPKTKKKDSKYPTDEKMRALIQIPVFKLILEGSGFRNLEIQNLEADDLIGILVRRAIKYDEDCEIIINSGDKDFYQLLAYPQVKILRNRQQGKLIYVTAKDVERQYGVKPKDWTKYRAWTGDTSDNIPHIFKVGKVRAKAMLKAGLDPSESDCRKVEKEAREKYAKYFAPHGIDRMWPSVHGNYQLCKIITDIRDEHLPRGVQEKLASALEKMRSIHRYYRREACKNPDNFRRVSFLLRQYELASIIARRDAFWNIP